jgi:hypothetical protein
MTSEIFTTKRRLRTSSSPSDAEDLIRANQAVTPRERRRLRR